MIASEMYSAIIQDATDLWALLFQGKVCANLGRNARIVAGVCVHKSVARFVQRSAQTVRAFLLLG